MLLLLTACSHTTEAPAERSTTDSAASPVDTAVDTPEHIGDAPAVEPGAALFADDAVHALTLTLDDAAWASLLAVPDAYVEATFSDGDAELRVGVRLKGYSSWQPLTGKPNVRVRFDHIVPGQRHDGLEAVDLVSEAEDPAAMSEALAYRVFRAAGLPASRTGFASLTMNGEAYGLYTLVEKKDDVLVARIWPDDDAGSLYESSSERWPCDFDDGGAPRCDCWEQDEVGADDTRADLETLCAVATDTPDADWYGAITTAVDWEDVSRHMAMEIVLDAHDHYAGYMGNVYLYHRPVDGGWSMLPASMNSAFGSARYVPGSCGTSGRVPADFAGGLLARRCWADAACAEDLGVAMAWAVDALVASDALERVDAWEALLAPYAETDARRGYAPADFHTHVACVRDWLAARPEALAPYLPVECLGSGGDLDVTGLGDLSTNGSCDRDRPDAVAYAVTDVDGTRVSVAGTDGIAAGDEVLVLVAQGDTAGEYVFARVVTVEAGALVLDAAPGVGATFVQRVPTYGSVTVRAGGRLTAGAWDGASGGVLAFRAESVTVEVGGAITMAGRGYAGGATGGAYNVDGFQGESVAGLGLGGASSVDGYNEANGAWAANFGGGGCNVGGGGGEHAGGATAGASWNGVATAPAAGGVYGAADRLTFGSGGGGVVNLGAGAGPGGAGGGAVFVVAQTISVEGALSADGADATAWAAGSYTYGAGGGAGGTVWLDAEVLALTPGAVTAAGGAGYAAVTRPGGDGGVGRVQLACGTLNGVVCEDGVGTAP